MQPLTWAPLCHAVFSILYNLCNPAGARSARAPQWEGGRLFDRSAGFFYGNSCNSESLGKMGQIDQI